MRIRSKRQEHWAAAITFASVLALSACTLGPDAERPNTAAHEAEGYVNSNTDPGLTTSPATLSPWWEEFGDEPTNQLVVDALAHNTDLQAAAARVLEAEAYLRQAGASRWPQVGYGASGSRQKNSFVLPEIGRVPIYSTNYATSLDVSYQVDLFGKLKRTRQSAWASLLAEEAAHDAVLHAVVANVVRARVQVATAERALDIAREILTSWEQTLDTVERRYRSGLVQAVDLYLARENLSATRATEVQLAAQVKLSRHALDVLVGRRAGAEPGPPRTLPELPNLEPVPMGLPIDLLDRRPDLRQAEMQLAASTYGIGIALADLYPSLTLTGSAGTTSSTIGDLIDIDGLVYNAVASIAGPLFTGGVRKAEVSAARARTEAASAIYAGAVLNALREVEDALVSDDANQERLQHTVRRLSEARSADRLARERYQRGVQGLLTVLETERRLRSSEEALITTKADLWNTRIDLFLALGGNWTPNDSRDDPEAQAQQDQAEIQETNTNREVS
ncbi:MAG: efflux transporter outer membrane subunit [bacterium]|nr:efflux transporter outer membrane subunit [bacterium]